MLMVLDKISAWQWTHQQPGTEAMAMGQVNGTGIALSSGNPYVEIILIQSKLLPGVRYDGLFDMEEPTCAALCCCPHSVGFPSLWEGH